MSIASEITRISGNVADAYTAANAKGATMPVSQNSDNLATTIATIPTGTTPTGTISITSNGTHDVTNYATADVNVPTTAPAYYVEKTVKNGWLCSDSTNVIDLTGVTALDAEVLAYAYSGYARGSSGTIPAFNNIDLDWSSISTFYRNCLYYCFAGRTGIRSIKLGASGSTLNGASYCFYYHTGIESCEIGCSVIVGSQGMFGYSSVKTANFPNLTSLKSGQSMFGNCSNLENISAPNLLTVQGSGDDQIGGFLSATKIQELILPKLTSVTGGTYSLGVMSNWLSSCTYLTKLSMPALETIGDSYSANGSNCGSFCYNCSALPTMKFESLSYVGRYAMKTFFDRCISLQSVWFYALDTNSFGSYTNQFNNMFSGCTDVTVHFPIRIQSTIGSWSSVTNGFGGTNTTVLFDIVTTLTGADGNTYTRQEKDSTTTATAWVYNDTLYYTSGVSDNDHGVNEPEVGDTIYSDSACTTAATTIATVA